MQIALAHAAALGQIISFSGKAGLRIKLRPAFSTQAVNHSLSEWFSFDTNRYRNFPYDTRKGGRPKNDLSSACTWLLLARFRKGRWLADSFMQFS